eukprot:g4136.t1
MPNAVDVYVRRLFRRLFSSNHRGRGRNLFQGYFSLTLLRTPFGTIRLSRHFTAWKGMFGLFLAVLSFLTYVWKGGSLWGGDLLFGTRRKAEDDPLYGKNSLVARLKSEQAFLSHPDLNLNVVPLPLPARPRSEEDGSASYAYKLPDYVYMLEVVKVYPHDPTSFTQGLFVDAEEDEDEDLVLVESLGQYGKSALQKRKLSTGEVVTSSGSTAGGSGEATTRLEFVNPPSEFGEGATYFKNFYWQLVWKKAEIHQYTTAYIHDEASDRSFKSSLQRVNTFNLTGLFDFDDGWGLTNDEEFLYATDSGNKLYKLELVYGNAVIKDENAPPAGAEPPVLTSAITGLRLATSPPSSSGSKLSAGMIPSDPSTWSSPAVGIGSGVKVKAKYNKIVEMPNELEFLPLDLSGRGQRTSGEVWANIFGKDCIARIQPDTGKVSGFVIAPLLRREHDLGANPDVMNGIAFHAKSGRLFITGKLWSKLFEVRLAPVKFELEWQVVKQLCVPEKNVFRAGR